MPLLPTKALSDALKASYIRETAYEDVHAIQFRKNVASYIQAAKLEMAPIARYTLAYEALHAIAVGVLYVHGLAPGNREGHRTQALSLMYGFLDLDLDDRSEITHASQTRNDKLYKSLAPPPSSATATYLLELAERVEKIARQKLPGWFALA
ncbi:hypothetical protein G3N95_08690 [Paraburkholderia sp. Tr-20389]|uniref:hypothetical protein n=1 Tax=Paraburkholderia sp. Tr-20389 TaxID=2703903 RepID=UPI0019803DA1|nr:hypothetical protein [Paraburkholderia sp. Tr-20389]MBN3753018.1 hypothetical protein [Paraburkholderia sp. Tr-20389]